MRSSFWATVVVGSVLAIADGAAGGTLLDRTLPPGSHPGSRERTYQVFVPDRMAADAAAPVVMVLHGCLQDEQNMIDETRFAELAEREGFIVIFPFVTSYPLLPPRAQNCWGFFVEQHRHEALGEPADLRRIFDAVADELAVDPERRYVTGLSSGAAMAVVMAVAYSEDIAAAGAVAGLPYGEGACAVANACFTGIAHQPITALVEAMQAEQQEPEEQRLVPVMVIHSTNDMTVPIRNAQNIRDAWIAHYDPDAMLASTDDCTIEGVPCQHSRFTDRQGRTVVETVFYNGPSSDRTHFWVGDHDGMFADPDGPSASELLWSFLEQHELTPAARAEIDIERATVAGTSATIRGTVATDTPVAQVLVRLDGEAPQAERPADGTRSFSARFDGLPEDQRYTPVVRVVFDDGAHQTAAGAEFALGRPPDAPVVSSVRGNFQEHILAGRIALQGPPCIIGFGVCDADINTLLFQHGVAPFALHNPAGSDRWYADPNSIATR